MALRSTATATGGAIRQPFRYPTVMVPFIWVGWYSQWNSYVPALAPFTVAVLVEPGGSSTLTLRPLIVRLCFAAPSFVAEIVTVFPAVRSMVVGVNE